MAFPFAADSSIWIKIASASNANLVHWQGKQLVVNWHRQFFKLLIVLARKRGRCADTAAVLWSVESSHASSLYSPWSRLKKLLPATLHKHVTPVEEKSQGVGYILNLNSQQVLLVLQARAT